jgi:hypothetical protein
MFYTKKFLSQSLLVLFSSIVILGIIVYQNTGTATANTTSQAVATSSYGWNSFMIGFHAGTNQGGVLNVDYTNGKSEALTQYVLYNPEYDGIAPNGKNLLYQQSMNGLTQYYTIFPAQTGGARFLYTQKGAGNAIWMPDSRHILVLNQNTGVTEVDTATNHVQKVLALPYTDLKGTYLDRIEALTFTNAGFLYFVGSGGGPCIGALCRIQLNTHNAAITRLSSRQTGATFWLSPDGRTIYYRNTGPAGAPGIYAVNSDGTHTRILRSGDPLGNNGVPIGFAADNSLVIMRHVGSKFQVVTLGATAGQDRVLLPDAAPGAVLLCDPSYKGSGITICDQNIALAPYGHAIIVQGTLANNKRILWSTNLVTGKQLRIRPLSLTAGVAVQLLGWDQLPVCAGNRC